MPVHWKFGHGFAIRYGGYRDIQWFKGKEFEQLSQTFSPQASPFSPVEMAVEMSKSVALFLQWWEMRKQTLLQAANFEERRITWLADILATWYGEIQQGIIRLDTIHYLDREISRLLNKIQGNDLIDTPSSLLLQIERSANLLVTLNKTVNSLIMEQGPNFILPDSNIPQPFHYQPYFKIEHSPQEFTEYISSANNVIEVNPMSMFSLGLELGTIASSLASSRLTSVIIGSILWTAPKLFEVQKKMKTKSGDRLQDFIALQNFSIELRSANSLLRLAQKLPLSLKSYSPEEIENNNAGQLILIEDMEGKQNDSDR